MSNLNDHTTRFRFSDHVTLVAESGHPVVVNNKPIAGEAEKARQADAEKERQTAYQQGWKDCEAKKLQEIKNLQSQTQQKLQELPAQLNHYLEELEDQTRTEIVDLSFRIAEYILERELSNHDDYRRVLNRLLEDLGGNVNIKLYVNPEVAATLAAGGKFRSGVEILPAPELKPGELKASSGQGIIDGTFASRLTTLRDELEKQLATTPAEEND